MQSRLRDVCAYHIVFREITEASAEPGVWVVVHLYASGMQECILVNRCFDQLAAKFKVSAYLILLIWVSTGTVYC